VILTDSLMAIQNLKDLRMEILKVILMDSQKEIQKEILN